MASGRPLTVVMKNFCFTSYSISNSIFSHSFTTVQDISCSIFQIFISKYLFQMECILQGSKFNVTSRTTVQQEKSRQQGTAHGMHFVNDDIINHVILQYAWTTLCSAAGQTPRQHGVTNGIHSVWYSP